MRFPTVLESLCDAISSLEMRYARAHQGGWRPTAEDCQLALDESERRDLSTLVSKATVAGIIPGGVDRYFLDTAIDHWDRQPLCVRALIRQLLAELRSSGAALRLVLQR